MYSYVTRELPELVLNEFDANASAQSDTSEDVVDAEFEEVKEDDKK